ncbi:MULTISPECIES: amidohydrolase [unclassified Halomonas]|uniref:M20 metallopeptidase family protein n=1 Tax=unclassified Halomonas TaxID=2609666 RepID=UPI001EF7361C|nr:MULTISPECIES: amidohydrolase [unclassified Halomonas]MCG7576486.1 amidohydrolase [Halomonas sp. MMH1-48]MCG7603549.1 amidohydrolase [Halomonas sp. MM17-34]MCG7612799.1 amidohydrolase [Halomonas sp. MM17-29]MCG7620762.1 amidohydrolase [Halomonas sp. DSH1-27]
MHSSPFFTQPQIDDAVAVRHQLHQHPELKFEETDTAKRVAERLTSLGYKVTEGIATTGVLAELDTGRKGPVIAFRADMDALPIKEANGFAHRSQREGLMHACGHDGHTATLLLAAEAIIAKRDQLCGYIKLLFQPGEEGGNGADEMVKAGVLKNPQVDAIFGYHNRPGFAEGQLFVKPGSAMGGNDTFKITIEGVSGHAAMPHLAVDPIYVGASLVQQLQGLVGRHKSPLEAGVITVAAFHAGDAANVIPGQAELLVNIRSDRESSRAALVGQLEQVVNGVCSAHGARFQLEHQHQIPPLVNDAAWSERVLAIAAEHGVSTDIQQLDYMPTMGAEDFAFYLQEVPGCFFFVGNGDSAYLHNERYDFNDAILPVAGGMFVALATSLLKRD